MQQAHALKSETARRRDVLWAVRGVLEKSWQWTKARCLRALWQYYYDFSSLLRKCVDRRYLNSSLFSAGLMCLQME